MNPVTMKGWRSANLTFSTTLINPDLYIHPTNRYELTQHPTIPTYTSLHRLDGTLICTIENRILGKPYDIYNSVTNNPSFEKSLALLIHQNGKQQHPKKILRELYLITAKNTIDTQPLMCGGWPIPDQLFDTLHDCFDIDRILHCNPYNLPLRASTYYSEDPFNKLFSAEPITNTVWTELTLSLPELQPNKLTKALEHAIYSTHTHTQRHATERNNTNTPRLETHTIPSPQPTHQLHPQKYHTPTHTQNNRDTPKKI